jgi:hypothetical protein
MGVSGGALFRLKGGNKSAQGTALRLRPEQNP